MKIFHCLFSSPKTHLKIPRRSEYTHLMFTKTDQMPVQSTSCNFCVCICVSLSKSTSQFHVCVKRYSNYNNNTKGFFCQSWFWTFYFFNLQRLKVKLINKKRIVHEKIVRDFDPRLSNFWAEMFEKCLYFFLFFLFVTLCWWF